MTKLEEEIWTAIMRVEDNQEKPSSEFFDIDGYSKAAAEVVKKYIKKAILDTFQNDIDAWSDPEKAMSAEDFYDKWLKENGISDEAPEVIN